MGDSDVNRGSIAGAILILGCLVAVVTLASAVTALGLARADSRAGLVYWRVTSAYGTSPKGNYAHRSSLRYCFGNNPTSFAIRFSVSGARAVRFGVTGPEAAQSSGRHHGPITVKASSTHWSKTEYIYTSWFGDLYGDSWMSAGRYALTISAHDHRLVRHTLRLIQTGSC
jgi:hypothetical protein